MKYQKILGLVATAGLLLAGCATDSDNNSTWLSDPNAVHVSASVGSIFTRSNPAASDEAGQKSFNTGDEISVQADGQDAVTYQLVGTEWQPQGGKFLKWESNEMNFTAYYPASFDGNIDNVTLPKEYDETSLAANDFMSYSGKQTNTNGNQLSLIMERKMARVVVEIDGFNDQYAEATVNSLSICGIKAYKHTDKKFYALIKPCAAQNSETFISLDVAEGESKTTETLTGIPTLTAGNSYTYKLTVGKDKISVSGIYVADWTTGDITGGKTEECPTPYITFTANGEQKFMMTTEGGYTISGLEYSVNNGKWTTVEAGTEVPFGGTNGDLRLRGISPNGSATDWYACSTIKFTEANVNVACTGDIRTLLDWRIYNIVGTNNARFCSLFKDCAVLTSAPELPATTLADFCYQRMFEGCTSLKTAPILPAENLARKCYSDMFDGCTSLVKAPALPAMVLTDYCYSSMFMNCTSLESAPELPATKLAKYCYSYMFYGCENLSSVTMLAPSDKIKDTSDSFNYWLDNAGTNDGITRKLIVLDEAAYNELVNNEAYLPAIWKKDQCTVKYYTPKP